MEQLIERFKLISSAIKLHEEEIVSSQTQKLLNFTLDLRAQDIIKSLKEYSYDEALLKITSYIRNFPNISVYKDSKIQDLQIKLRALESDLNILTEKKNQHLADIDEFISLFHYYLHEEVKDILAQKIENATKAFSSNKITKNDFEKIKKQVENYKSLNIDSKQISVLKLNEEENLQIKSLYKKANRRINPDILLHDHKQHSENLFKALNHAFLKRDLATVKKIQKTIEENPKQIYGFDKIDDKNILTKHLKNLQIKIELLKKEILELENSKIYDFLSSTKDIEKYFKDTKEFLLSKKNELSKI